jgi:hypothetical protein
MKKIKSVAFVILVCLFASCNDVVGTVSGNGNGGGGISEEPAAGDENDEPVDPAEPVEPEEDAPAVGEKTPPTEEEIPFLGRWGYADHYIDMEFYENGIVRMGDEAKVWHGAETGRYAGIGEKWGEWRTTGKLGTIEIRFKEKTSWQPIDYCKGKWSKATLRRHGIAPNQLWPSVYLTYGENGLACMDFEGTHIRDYKAALIAADLAPAKN